MLETTHLAVVKPADKEMSIVARWAIRSTTFGIIFLQLSSRSRRKVHKYRQACLLISSNRLVDLSVSPLNSVGFCNSNLYVCIYVGKYMSTYHLLSLFSLFAEILLEVYFVFY